MTESPGLRIGDAERERAAADLGEHFAQGRLSADEHAERLEQVWVAKTQAQLVPLFRDLPGGAYGASPAAATSPGKATRTRRREPAWRRRRLPVPVFAIVPLLILLTVALHAPFLLFGLFVLFLATRNRRHAAWGHRRF